jgi:hypothetical protein
MLKFTRDHEWISQVDARMDEQAYRSLVESTASAQGAQTE